jgi:2-polyprenyl-3-methyl-5-hydroxy-6-metoxy-1,4-benzoquinol methylase
LNRILDIGCGLGFFLEVAQELNWKTYGTEYTETAVEKCSQKGITMYKGDLTEIEFGELTFDVITCIEVIEHIQDLKSFMIGIKKILRPGGILYLTTPNILSLNSRILKENWNVLCYPEHLSYFSKKSLNKLLVSNSFEKLFLVSDGVSPERLLTSFRKKTVDHSTPENKDEKFRVQLEKNSFLKTVKRIVNGFLNISNLGESLKSLYKLKDDDTTPLL